MEIGALKKRVTIQCPTKASDLMGGFTNTWTDHATVWAAIWPVSAGDVIRSEKDTNEVTTRIRIRHRYAMRPSWRIKFGDRYFNIISIINVREENKLLDLLAKEVF